MPQKARGRVPIRPPPFRRSRKPIRDRQQNPDRQGETEGGPGIEAFQRQGQENAGGHRNRQRPFQTRHHVGEAGFLPARQGADAHQEQGGGHERHEYRVEVGRADGNLAHAQRVDEQGIQRSQQHRAEGGQQDHVVGQQQRFAREPGETAAGEHLGRAPGIERQGTADDEDQEAQDAGAPRRVGGEGVHQESTPERTRKVPSRESEKAISANSTVQALKAPRFSVTAREWISAVPASQGMKEAFSVGSQNHQPPQLSSR